MNGKVTELVETVSTRLDSWKNALTGLGTLARDKVLSAEFVVDAELEPKVLASFYASNDMAAKIIRKPVYEAVRPGFEVSVDTDEDGSELDSIQLGDSVVSYLDDNMAFTKLVKAWVWGRLLGGGGLYVVANDGVDQSLPLQMDRIQNIVGYQVLELEEMNVESHYDDPMVPRFGEPETFRVAPINRTGSTSAKVGAIVHESRIIRFEGEERPRTLARTSTHGWGGNSVLQRVYNPLRAFDTFWQALTHLCQDAPQGVFKLQGLIAAVAGGQEELLGKRMQIVDMSRSVSRALMLDAEMEEFERLPHNLGGLEKIADSFAQRLAAAADMPVTLLMGKSPGGLNATGESDERQWYDYVAQTRESDFQPQLERLLTIVMSVQDGPTGGKVPDDWAIKWKPLRQMTEAEIAELRKKTAETDNIYMASGVLLPEEVAISRFQATGWSMETQIDSELREEVLELEKERELERVKNPPAPPQAPNLNLPPGADPEAGDDSEEEETEEEEE